MEGVGSGVDESGGEDGMVVKCWVSVWNFWDFEWREVWVVVKVG